MTTTPSPPVESSGRSAKMPTPRTPTKSASSPAKGSKQSAVKPSAADEVDPFDGLDDLTEKKFLAAQKALLEHERVIRSEQSIMLRAEADQLAEDMEPGDVQFDDESGEGATMGVERERDLAMSAQAAADVEEIDRALARIEAGTYGICEGCRKPIVRARLRAMPFALLCVSCKSGGLSRR